MFTNSDIGLTKDFYSHLLPKLDNKEAISINRITIGTTNEMKNMSNQYYYNNYNNNSGDDNNISNNKNNLISDMLLNKIDNTIQNGSGRKHPGTDCFIVHSNVLNRIKIGDVFAGYPPWAGAYRRILKIMARNYTIYKSKQSYNFLDDGIKKTKHYGGGRTFHIGDERKWKMTDKKSIINSEFDTFKKKLCYNNYIGLKHCGPAETSNHPYATLNKLNSYILWLPRNNNNNNTNSNNNYTNTSINNNNNNSSTTNIISRIIPNFVQPGYEEFYINQMNSRNVCKKELGLKRNRYYDWYKSICQLQSVNN
jgi:hypothetical protein